MHMRYLNNLCCSIIFMWMQKSAQMVTTGQWRLMPLILLRRTGPRIIVAEAVIMISMEAVQSPIRQKDSSGIIVNGLEFHFAIMASSWTMAIRLYLCLKKLPIIAFNIQGGIWESAMVIGKKFLSTILIPCSQLIR